METHETNGHATLTLKLLPTAGYMVIQRPKLNKTHRGLELAGGAGDKLSDLVIGRVIGVGPAKHELGSVYEPPCSEDDEVLVPMAAGWNATKFLTMHRGIDVADDIDIVVIAFNDAICVVKEQ